MTAALFAAQHGDLTSLQHLVNAGIDLTLSDTQGRNALMFAAIYEHSRCVRFILESLASRSRGASLLEHRTDSGATALMLAAREGATQSAKILLDAGSDVNARDNAGFTSLMYALKKGYPITKLLLEHGADVNVIAEDGNTPLNIALGSIPVRDNDYRYFVTDLLRRGADPSICKFGWLYFGKVIIDGNTDIIRQMVINGCPPLNMPVKDLGLTWTDRESLSPLMIALLLPQPYVAKYFIDNNFLTYSDILQLLRVSEIKVELATSEFLLSDGAQNTIDQVNEILQTLSQAPPSLFTLSFVTVSETLEKSRLAAMEQRSRFVVRSPGGAHPLGLRSRLCRVFGKRTQPKCEDTTYKTTTKLSTNATSIKPNAPLLSRREQVECLGLPVSLQQALLFKTQNARICPHLWHTIGLRNDNSTKCHCGQC